MEGKGCKITSACFSCARALESHAGSCLQLCRRDQSVPHLGGRRGEPGSLRLSLSSPSQLCPFSPSPSFSLQKWPGLSFLGQKRSLFPVLQKSLGLALCVRHRSLISQCDCQKEEFFEGFYSKPEVVLSHIFLVSPQIFTLSSWSVVAMPAEAGFLTSRLKHKIDNQASWVLLNSTTYICIAYQGFGVCFFFAFFLCCYGIADHFGPLYGVVCKMRCDVARGNGA